MESEAVLDIYQRSVVNYGIRYIPFIGDGDSSSYSAVDKNRPYGPSVFVDKQECVNHATKRMGTNLRSLVREYKGKYISLLIDTNFNFSNANCFFIAIKHLKAGV